ncbi:MAG TPA: flagellar filament capping protein FliD [Syntrophorhabdaceae bacterium]|nr:flagellar filament capping protein FliD [Syntrophorhabdaceae bacterium]
MADVYVPQASGLSRERIVEIARTIIDEFASTVQALSVRSQEPAPTSVSTPAAATAHEAVSPGNDPSSFCSGNHLAIPSGQNVLPAYENDRSSRQTPPVSIELELGQDREAVQPGSVFGQRGQISQAEGATSDGSNVHFELATHGGLPNSSGARGKDLFPLDRAADASSGFEGSGRAVYDPTIPGEVSQTISDGERYQVQSAWDEAGKIVQKRWQAGFKASTPIPRMDSTETSARPQATGDAMMERKTSEGTLASEKVSPDVSLKPEGDENPVVVTLDTSHVSHAIARAQDNSHEQVRGSTGPEKGGVAGTVRLAHEPGQIESKTVGTTPDQTMTSPDNHAILKLTIEFVNRMNLLVSEAAPDSEGADEVNADAASSPGVCADKLDCVRRMAPELRSAIQSAVNRGLSQSEDNLNAESIGLSTGKNGSLHLDTTLLASQLTMRKEETLNVIKGFGNTLSERISYLANPYGGMYLDDSNVRELKASQKNQGTSLFNRQLNTEQDGLQKRLNELNLLIGRSALLTDWFTEPVNPDRQGTVVETP